MKKRYSGKSISLPAGIAIGTGVSVICILAGAAILAWLIGSERVGEDAIGWCGMLILPMASAAGCVTSWNRIRRKRLMVAGLQCAAFYGVLLVMALPFGGQLQGLGSTALLILLGGGISVIPALIGNRSGAHRYAKGAFR